MRMMTSVSMLVRMIGAAMAVSLVKGFGISALHRSHVGDGAGDRRRRRPRRARQMGARARPLAADEIAVGGRDRALAGRHVSPLAARHIEQPGSRHSKPASVNSLSSPSATASRLTVSEPGTTQARTPGATLRPRATSAAARRSLSRLLVQEPMKTQSTGVPAIGAPAFEAHIVERGLERGAARRIGDRLRDPECGRRRR